MSQDFYELLGVDRATDAKTLKAAYRKLAMQYHPDRNPGDDVAEHKFKEISHAYDVLKDDQKRAAYDRYGHEAFESGGMGGPAGGQGFGSAGFSDVFDDLFGEFMGSTRGRRRGGPARGPDLRYNMGIELHDAFAGCQQKVTIETAVKCGDCNGSGAEAGSRPEACPQCNGAGKIRQTQGFFMVERTCPACQGQGHVIKNPCQSCRGQGRVSKQKTLNVKVPKGVEDGTRIRLTGEGEAGAQGGPSGDLYIFIQIEPHKVFERDGTTIYCRVPIPMTTAVLGGEIPVPTVGGGRANVKIPVGTQTGKQFRLRGKGMPQLNSGLVGDMILEAFIETPVNLNKKQRQFIRDFADDAGDAVSPEAQGFLNKVREFWDDLTE